MAWLNFKQAQSNSKKWPKKIKLPQMKLFLKKNKIKCSCTYQPLSFCKIFKKILQSIYIMRMHKFCAQNGLFAPIFLENINIILIYLLAPFTVQASKKSSQRIHDVVMTIGYFWVQNGPFAQMRISFQKIYY